MSEDEKQKRKETQKTLHSKSLNLYKKLCETPRERLERLRTEKPQYASEVLSYAGRLDPMAEGVLIALVGSENKNREKYLELDKEYILDVLFGFSTDSYDILGKVLNSGDPSDITPQRVRQALNEFRGTLAQEYPPYSSKTVEGKSLWSWARSGAIDALILPRRTVTIYDIAVEKFYKIKEPQLFAYIEDAVTKVQGDFRQEEILRLWGRELRKTGAREFPCASIKITCSSGTYARGIANKLGNLLDVPALSLHILRTRVGEYTVEKAWK